ncbi:MAG: radical SAM protein [Deltaproteobacteria bacterium]|nr:radical SAM protein [Deltaproteobacteria bacterium]
MKKRDIRKKRRKKTPFLTAVVANEAGEVVELEGFAAVGMAGNTLVPLTSDETLEMPFGSELMLMPDRKPVLYHINSRKFETLAENPIAPGESIYPVAVFNSPGHLISYVSAYMEEDGAGYLPLFSYGVVGWKDGNFKTAVIHVDKEKRQDLRLMRTEDVTAGIKRMRKKMPANRLREHLETCALAYGCPASKNFFIGRYEAPLPTAPHCNARCLGCLSLQGDGQIPHSQDRITFKPSPEEIAEVALEHIRKVKQSIVSFGQGCEGDPLLAADVIEGAISIIRSNTQAGTINMNTNGSMPEILGRLFDKGLDSIRISLNSVRKACYDAYFRPRGYSFFDVKKSISTALGRGKFVSINYLNLPGFTDTPEEVDTLVEFLGQHPINMIQWRNLNIDPIRYWKVMSDIVEHGTPIGMRNLYNKIRASFPNLKHGYFNPPKEKFLHKKRRE